jgi:hypothetical protein
MKVKGEIPWQKIPTCASFGVNDESLIEVKVLNVNIEFYVILNQ